MSQKKQKRRGARGQPGKSNSSGAGAVGSVVKELPFALKERPDKDPFFAAKLAQIPPANQANLIDAFKFLAAISMVLLHVGDLFFPGYGWYQLLGQVAFPIFLFFVGTGTRLPIDLRLVLPAISVALLTFVHNESIFPLNILFSIILVRLFLRLLVWNGQERVFWYLPPIIAITAWCTAPVFEEGTLALAAALVGFIARRSREDRLGYYVALSCGIICGLAATSLSQDQLSKFCLFFIVVFAFGLAYVYRVRRLNRIFQPYIPSIILIVTRHLPEFYVLHWAVLYAIFHFHQDKSFIQLFK